MDSIQPRRKVAFPKGDKALMPIRCPNLDHDKRTGFPLRFGLGEEKDNLLEQRLLQNMKLSDIDKLVDEACDGEKLPEPRRSTGQLVLGDKSSECETQLPYPPDQRRSATRNNRVGPSENDMSLVTAMASRLRQAEQATASLREEIKKKDILIAQLRADIEKTVTADAAKPCEIAPRPSDLAMMREHNAKLRELLRRADEDNKLIVKENEDIKKFLKDYGLAWVGDGEEAMNDKDRSTGKDSKDLLLHGDMWHPAVAQGDNEATASSDLNSRAGIEALGVPFDPARILANVQQLNIIAEEGCKEVVRGADGIRRLQDKSLVKPLPFHTHTLLLVPPRPAQA
jgi:hypothetical protein